MNDLEFLHSMNETPLSIIQKENDRFSNTVAINGCTFDDWNGQDNKCFYLLIETFTISFKNCVIQNMKEGSTEGYIGVFNTKELTQLVLENISFINNRCDSLYGGWIGIKFIELGSLLFRECKFINNYAITNKSASRPSLGNKEYFNGDGGALQLGSICGMNDMQVHFMDCTFKGKRANKHGGAISIQTYDMVYIEYCIFEDNVANYDSSSSKLLNDNYFDFKSEGRGGAIYVNPAYSYDPSGECHLPSAPMTNCVIDNCRFKSNKAHDGYAIYIEGDDPNTKFDIKLNNFIDNYNENNHKVTVLTMVHVISTEIWRLSVEQIKTDNTFSYTEQINVKEVSCGDHYGHTQTMQFSGSHAFSPSIQFTPSPQFSIESSAEQEVVS